MATESRCSCEWSEFDGLLYLRELDEYCPSLELHQTALNGGVDLQRDPAKIRHFTMHEPRTMRKMTVTDGEVNEDA